MDTIRSYWERWRLGYWMAGAVSAAFVVSVLLLLSAYILPSGWTSVRSVRGLMPFPLVLVSGRPATTYADVSRNLTALRTFYESQDFSSIGLRVDFSTPEGQERLRIREREIINKAIEDAEIRRLAEDRGIRFSEKDAMEETLRKARETDGESAARENVGRLYGWDLERFAREVVLSDLYRTALERSFSSDPGRFAEAKSRIAEAEDMLADGRSFRDVSSAVSEGGTADSGGSLGWFTYDQLIGPLREPARTIGIGTPSPVIESDLGFHILLVDGRRTETGEEMVGISQIFVRKETFGDWLTEELRKADVRVLAPEYRWDAETASVEFRDGSLREREQELLERAEGDASVMF